MHRLDDFNPATPQEKAIGDRLFLLKRLLVKSDLEFCIDLMLHPSLLWKLEEGLLPPSMELCQKLSDVYGVRLDWFLMGDDRIFNTKGPKTPFISIRIDSYLYYKDPLFITAVNLLWITDMSEEKIKNALTIMFVNEEQVMKEKRAIQKVNHILSHL